MSTNPAKTHVAGLVAKRNLQVKYLRVILDNKLSFFIHKEKENAGKAVIALWVYRRMTGGLELSIMYWPYT